METSVDCQPKYDVWKVSVRNNFQNFIRAINKQFVYCAESSLWTLPLEETEGNTLWALSVMDKFCENEKMVAHCQGFYRETVKYLVAAYLRNGMTEKASEKWN